MEGKDSKVRISASGASKPPSFYDVVAKVRPRKTAKIQCRPLIGHQSKISSAALHTDNKTIYSTSADNTVRTWDFEECSLLSNKVISAGYQDGKITGITTSSRYAVCTTTTGSLLLLELDNLLDQPRRCKITRASVGKVVFSGDESKVLIPAGDSVTYLYDVKRNVVVKRLMGHESSVKGAIFTRNSRSCITVSLDKRLMYWDLRMSRPLVTTLQLPFPAWCVTQAPNGLVVVGGMSHDVYVYDMGLRTPLWVCKGHTAWTSHIAATDSQFVYSSADYDGIGKIDTLTGSVKVLCSVELETVFDMQFSGAHNALRIIGIPFVDDVRSYRKGEVSGAGENLHDLYNSRQNSTRDMDMILKEEYVRAWQRQSQVISFSEALQGSAADSKSTTSSNWRRESVEEMARECEKVRRSGMAVGNLKRTSVDTKLRAGNERGGVGCVTNKTRRNVPSKESLPVLPMPLPNTASVRRDTAFRLKPILVKRSSALMNKKNIHYE